MTEEVKIDLEVSSVGVSEKAYFDGDGNEVLRVLYTTTAKSKNGPRVTFQGTEAFAWRVGDPLAIRVTSTQAHLDEYEEKEGD